MTILQKHKRRLSVVIPLYDKRVSEEECLASWCDKQTLARGEFEVIVTSNGEDPEAEQRVRKALRAPDRLVCDSDANMAGLYHLGACEAKADVVFFTELHCVANEHALEKLLEFLDTHPELSGACQRSLGGCLNTFARAERDLFDVQYEQWCKPDDWRKVVVRGVAIRKDAYFSAGGFDARYNRFADWILGAKLHRQGHRLGYASESMHLHYYCTNYLDFQQAVIEHTHDECAYRTASSPEFCQQYYGVPADWSQQHSLLPESGREALRLSLSGIRNRPSALKSLATWKELWHWGTVSVTGAHWKLAVGKLGMWKARLRCWRARKTLNELKLAYLHAFRCTDDYFRLKFLVEQSKCRSEHSNDSATNTELVSASNESVIGFYSTEHWQGNVFRWCQGVGIFEIRTAARERRLRIELLSVRGDIRSHLTGVFINGRRIPESMLQLEHDSIVVDLDASWFQEDGKQRVGITCIPARRPSADSDERRTLGFAVKRIELLDLDECLSELHASAMQAA